MRKNRISIRNGAGKAPRGDRRCNQRDCIFPSPTIQFDLDGRRVVAVWSWTGVGVAGDGNRIRINVMPNMLLVPVSHN